MDDVQLKPAAKVTGRVTDSRTGKPIVDATITAQYDGLTSPEGGWGEGKTDQNGIYVIGGLASGEYRLMLSKCRFKTLTAPVKKCELMAAAKSSQHDFALTLGKRLVGRVIDVATNTAISNCPIRVSGPDGWQAFVETDSDGKFEVFVVPGPFQVSVADHREDETEQSIEVPSDLDPEPVVLKAGAKIENQHMRVKFFLGPALERKVTFDFQDTPFVEVLDQIFKSAAAKYELDADGLKDVGYSKQMKVTAKADRISLGDALNLILEPFEKLSFVEDKFDVEFVNRGVFISSRDRVKNRTLAKSPK